MIPSVPVSPRAAAQSRRSLGELTHLASRLVLRELIDLLSDTAIEFDTAQ